MRQYFYFIIIVIASGINLGEKFGRGSEAKA